MLLPIFTEVSKKIRVWALIALYVLQTQHAPVWSHLRVGFENFYQNNIILLDLLYQLHFWDA